MHDILIQYSAQSYQYYEVRINDRKVDFIIYTDCTLDTDTEIKKNMMIDIILNSLPYDDTEFLNRIRQTKVTYLNFELNIK